MRYILILLLLVSTAYGQFAPTSAKTKFVNGIAIGSRDTSQFTAADTIALTIARDSVMYYRYRGFWRPIATGGNLSAYKLISDTLFNNGYTTRARLKQGLDSLAATKVSSVGLTMPSAFNVANSPITTSGTIAVTAAGNASQYIRGDGVLANLPTNGGGGGASVSYYLNGSVNQGTIGGVTYYEMNKTPIIGAGTDFTRNSNGYIASFLTDANDPALLVIPAGNWNFETYFEASSGGGTPTFYIELYKYDGTTFTLIASNSTSPKSINDGTNIEAYFSALAVPQTTLTLTDRLAIRIFVTTAGRTITLHTENNTLCQVITTFTTGLTALNGLTAQVQYFATGTSGSDFNISSATDTHTFNLPTASATNRGALSSANWTTFNNKIGAGDTAAMLLPYLRKSDTATMLAPFIQYSDTTGLLSQVVRTFGTQTIGGNKTFSNDIVVNGLTVGRGGGSNSQNTSVGNGSLNSNTTGTRNSAFGLDALFTNISGSDNTALGRGALKNISTTSGNIGIGFSAGEFITGSFPNSASSNSIFIGNQTNAAASTQTNQIVIGHQATGNGSNTVTIGNSSVTNNYFTGNVRGGAFIRNGGTSSQFLKADGSVDGTSYATAASLSGYVPYSGATGAVNLGVNTLTAGRTTISTNDQSTNRLTLTNTGSGGRSYSVVGGLNGANNSSFSIYDETAAATRFSINSSGASDFFGTLNGTSLSMSGGGSFGGQLISTSPSAAVVISNAADVWYRVIRGSSYTNIGVDATGSFYNTNTSHRFFTQDGVVQALTIASTGNIGIGTTSPSSISGYTVLSLNNATNGGMLDLKSNGTSLGFIYAFDNSINIGSNGTAPINFLTASGNQRGQWASDGTFLINTTTTDGTNKLIVNGSTKVSERVLAGSTSNTLNAFSGTNNSLAQATVYSYNDNAAGWSIYSAKGINYFAGNTGIGTTSPSRDLDINGNLRVRSGAIDLSNDFNNQVYSLSNALYLKVNGTERLTIASTGAATFSSSVTATGFIVSSSKTLKDVYYRNKQSDGIDFVGYTWKKNLNLDNKKHLGFIAEEVEKVMPDAVSANEKGIKAVNYTEVLIYKLEKLTERIDELEDEVKRLKRKRN